MSEGSHDAFEMELLQGNLLGVETLDALKTLERRITKFRYAQLQRHPIQGSWDYRHLKSIHRELFQDLYPWAGQDRYTMGLHRVFCKGSTCFTPAERLPEVSERLFGALADENFFRGLPHPEFVRKMAIFMNGLNLLHPFREGNGRVQRIFMESLAETAGYALDFTEVSQSMMVQAAILGSKGRLEGYEVLLARYSEPL